jgi:hypothetical protein
MGKMRNAYKVLVGKPEGMKPLGRLGCKWEDNIKMDLGQTGLEGMDYTYWAEDRDWWKGSCKHDNEPSGSMKGGEYLV